MPNNNQYCIDCAHHKHVDTMYEIVCCIEETCFRKELDHKGLRTGVLIPQKAKELVEEINKIIDSRLQKQFTLDPMPTGPMPPKRPSSALPMKLKLDRKSWKLEFEYEDMKSMWETIMNNCSLNIDFDCRYYEYDGVDFHQEGESDE